MSGVPTAVSPGALTPGFYLVVNLLAGVSSPGTGIIEGMVMTPRSSAGDMTVDTEIRLIGSLDDALTAFGPKTPGYLHAAAFFARNPAGVLWAVCPTASGGNSATGTITFASTPTVAQTVRITIAGKVTDVPWAASESADTIKTRCIAQLNSRPLVPATASSGGTGVLTLTAPIAGPWGNDIIYSVLLLDGTGGTATATGSAFTGGTTEPDFSTAFSTISGQQYDYICPLLSNADAQSSGGSTNVAKLKTHINNNNTGLDAKLQQGIIGTSGTISAAKTGATARNEPTIEYLHCQAGQGLPCELAGEEMGLRMLAVGLDPAMNRIGTILPNYVGPADRVADKPTPAEVEDALANGVTIISQNRQGQCFIVRPITSHSQDANGNPDSRCFDISKVDAAYAIAKGLQTYLPQEYPNAKLAPDQEPGDEPLPDGIVEPRDIKASVVVYLRTWETRGVIRKDKLDEAIADGTLIVRVNPSDDTQVDIVVPEKVLAPLAKMGVVVNAL